jgi:hypothetical protein
MKGRRGFAVVLLVLFGILGLQRAQAAPSLWVGPPMKTIDPPFQRFYKLLENGKFADSRIYGNASVVLLYPKYAREGEVSDMRPFMANLRAAGRQVAFEGPLLKLGPDKCGQTLESFGFIPARALLDKLHQAGAPLTRMVIDEPVWYASVFHGAHACGYSPQELAAQIAASIHTASAVSGAALRRGRAHRRAAHAEDAGRRRRLSVGAFDAGRAPGLHAVRRALGAGLEETGGGAGENRAQARLEGRSDCERKPFIAERRRLERTGFGQLRAAVPLIHPDQIVVQSWVTSPSVDAGDGPGTFGALVKAVSGQMHPQMHH